MQSSALCSAQTTVSPLKMLIYTWKALYAVADSGFITPRSAVRSRPPLPMESISYGGQRTWPLLRCVQFVSTLRIQHHGLDSRSLVSLSGSNITRCGLDL